MRKELDRIGDKVVTRLKLDAKQKKTFIEQLRTQYAWYELSVKRYGTNVRRVASDYNPRRAEGVSKKDALLTPEQREQWEANISAWHPYLQVLFRK